MIDFEDLVEIADDCGCTFSLCVRTGDFIHRDLPLMEIKGCAPETVEERVRECFNLGSLRTPEQDPEFLIDELVEIGLRALSPGINDPFTAITALHWLGAATSEIARRDLRKRICEDDAEDCPVIPRFDGFAHFLDRGFASMRSAVAASGNATMVMLDVIANAAAPVKDEDRRGKLLEQGRLLVEQAREALVGPDLDRVEKRYRVFEERFEN
jgi:uncharacterized membrane protein